MMSRVIMASLLAHRLRLILTAAAIGIGVALVTGTFILTNSVQAVLGGASSATSAGYVVVQPAGAGGGKGGSASASLAAGLVARVGTVPGVAWAQGLVAAAKVTLIGKHGRPIVHRRAVNELLTYPSRPAMAAEYTITAGRAPRGLDETLIDAATARALGYGVGDRIGVATTPGIRTLTIVGITGFGGADSPPGAQIASFDAPTVLVVPVATAQQLAGLPGRFTEIDARVAAGVSVAEVATRLAPLLPPGIEAITGKQAASQQAAVAAGYVASLRADLLAFCAVALLVGAFVIADTFAILTAQRTREYALLRISGATGGQVLRWALAEAALLGLAASAAGTGLGVLAATGLRAIISLLGGSLPAAGLVFAPRTAVLAMVIGTATTVAAALRAARMAARVLPIQALRDTHQAARAPSARRLAAGSALGAAAAALIVTGALAQGSQNTALAGAGAVLAVAALVTAAPLIAAPVARFTAAPVAHRRNASVVALLARDNCASNPRRTAATAAILTIGLAAAGAVSILTASAGASANYAIAATSHADLYLLGSISPDLARAVANRAGVAATMRVDDPLVRVAGAQARVAGIDAASGSDLIDVDVRTGALSALRGDTLLVSAPQAARHGWHVGSRVTVSFGNGPPKTLTVAGTFADKRFLGDDYLMPIATLFRDMPDQLGQASMLLIRAVSRTSLLRLRAAIGTLLPAHPGTTLQTAAQYQRMRASDLGDLSHAIGLLTVLVALTEVIAALGIANTLTLSIAERAGEFAVIRALGLTRGQLGAMIHAESVVMCLLGALPGAVLGVGAGAALAATITRDQTGVATIALSPAPLAAALAVTCLTALLAGAIPARHAARVAIAQARPE